jgi:hypothetical protein
MAKGEYHFSGSKVNTSLDEPFHLTKFTAVWTLPDALKKKYGTDLLTLQLLNAKGFDLGKMPELIEQQYKNVKRSFVGTVESTGGLLDIETTFEINVDRNNVVYPYNILRDWTKLQYDPETGLQVRKKDHVGTFSLEAFAKDGDILMKFYAPIFFPMTKTAQFDFDYANQANYQLPMTWRAENWSNKMIGQEVGGG